MDWKDDCIIRQVVPTRLAVRSIGRRNYDNVQLCNGARKYIFASTANASEALRKEHVNDAAPRTMAIGSPHFCLIHIVRVSKGYYGPRGHRNKWIIFLAYSFLLIYCLLLREQSAAAGKV
jgi:hypothetical protein